MWLMYQQGRLCPQSKHTHTHTHLFTLAGGESELVCEEAHKHGQQVELETILIRVQGVPPAAHSTHTTMLIMAEKKKKERVRRHLVPTTTSSDPSQQCLNCTVTG